MDKIEIIEREDLGGNSVHVVITREDGSQLSMLKSDWDELEAQREQSGTL